MLKNKRNKIYSVLSTMLLLLTIITIVVIFGVLKINDINVAAATTTLTVNKKVSVDTYVYGEDVVYDEENSNLAVDKYIVEIGSKVYIRAVNDTALFTQWTISNNSVETTSTNVHETITVNGEVTISLDVKEAEGFVNGKIMYDMIPVTEANHLLAIQKILEAGSTANVSSLIDQYDLLFGNNNYYRTATNKAEFITTNKLFDIVQTGYYGINNNLSVFSSQFKGIGNATTPFKGVFVGVDEGTSIITTISQNESAGTNNFGLFSVLDKEAVLLNLNIQTAIGISESTSSITGTSIINAGGIAGTFNNAFVHNTKVKSIISINSGYSEINAGGIAGKMTGGLNSINKSSYDGTATNWIINNKSDKSSYVGYIAGQANNVYLKDFTITTTNSDVMLSSSADDTSATNNLGTLYGKYNGSETSEISNVVIKCEGVSRMQSIINYGTSYVGGAIGYVDADKELVIGDINFINTSEQNSKFISQSLDSLSHADVYSGGLFARIADDSVVNASAEFKSNIKSITIEDKIIKKGEYIFSGNYSIESTYHGYINTGLDYGRCVAGGLVGKGYFNILGSGANNSQILIHDNIGKLSVIATQSQTVESQTKSGNGDVEHCVASLVFGLITQDTNNITISDIDVYATNVLVNAVRENGSEGSGDVRVSGLNGYSTGTSFTDINMYVNASQFKLDSLSYEVLNSQAGENNAYCGGILADVRSGTVSYLKVAGYDQKEFGEIGTTLYMMSIQNTISPKGTNYVAENYVGGIIGHTQFVNSTSYLEYNGSETTEDAIILQGHENPDSCFCGGLIGLIKTVGSTNNNYVVSNSKVKNASIQAQATVNDGSSENYDIMIGGAVGAIYTEANSIVGTYNNIYVYNSEIRGTANERIEVNAGGIFGANTWNNSTHTYNNCYVYGSKVSAVSNTATNSALAQAYAGGIVGHLSQTYMTFNNCAVIDSLVESSGRTAVTAGIGRNENANSVTINNCYINSILTGNTVRTFTNHGTPTYSRTKNYTYYTSAVGGTKPGDTNLISGNDLQVTGNTNLSAVIAQYAGNKVYPVLKDGSSFAVHNAGTEENVYISKTTTNENAVDILEIWINANDNGSTTNPTSMSAEAAHDAGWFLIETINVYSGSNTFTDLDHLVDNYKFVYTDGSNEYKYSSGAYDGNNSNRYLEHILDSSIKVRGGYAEGAAETFTVGTTTYNVIKNIDINVYENMHNIKLDFAVSNMPTYEVVLLDTDGNVISKNPNALDQYGTYNFIYNIDTVNNKISYTLNYYPNPEMTGTADITFYVAFKVGRTTSGTYYDSSMFKINLSPNVRKLESLKPAEYSPPLNIRDAGIGVSGKPYILEDDSITKFIPVFSRVNDLEHILYDADTNVEYATFSRTGATSTIYSNGELKVTSPADTEYTVMATSKINTSETATVYWISPNQTVYDVTYTSVGADVTSLGRATEKCEFYFDIEVYSSYSSLLNADNFKITIGTSSTAFTTYMLYDSEGHLIEDDPTTTGINEALVGREGETKYTVVIPRGSIKGKIDININLDVTYNVTFVLNCSKFNPTYDGPLTRTYKVIAGDGLDDYFKNTDATGEIYDELKVWVDAATLFGYAFNGFYLVDNADSLPAYGYDLNTLVEEEEKVNTSLTFYACWSFLIELIEAPGTHITTSFADSFMKDYYDENKVTSTIKIPINSNRGYIFTIEKDPGFIGEAEVRAFALTKHGEEIITDEIAIEKYHENQYLYYIPPEAIKGYLVIATSVGNSELIVGENSASVSENLLPYDGIYTFKYVVNHRNSADHQSFIYNSDVVGNKNANLEYNRDVMLEFFEQTFNGTNLGQKPRYLEKGTVIEVYYHLYVNGTETQKVVGSYIVNDSVTSRVFLKDFTLINNDGSTKAFNEIKFKDLLGSNEMVSEVYYFSVTPPNGITLDNNKIINYIVNAGYYYNDGGNYRYIEGKRVVKDFINKPLQGELEVIVLNESALHQNIYSVSPSRDTELTTKNETNLEFNFKDITNYHILNLTATNTEVYADALKLKGTIGSRSTLTSSRLGFFIKDIEIVAGYNTGNIDVYGSNDGSSWTLIDTIYVESEEYQKYILYFNENYTFFKLDNTSGNDIHIKELLVADLQTAIHYEMDFVETTPTVDGTTLTYQLINNIVGDIRHDTKKFMLAVQMYDVNGKLVTSIDPTVCLKINGTNYQANDEGSVGRSVMFFNLTDIKEALAVDNFDFQIVLPTEYAGYQLVIQLVEAKMSYKPAMDEVRETINLLKQAIVSYEYKYLSGAISSGSVDNPNNTTITSETILGAPTDGDLLFGGWYLDADLTQKVESVSISDGNSVIYGAFYPKTTAVHELKFMHGSTEIYKVTLPVGGKVITPDFVGLAPEGHQFSGWKNGSDVYASGAVFTMGEADTSFEAYFTPRTYTISFNIDSTRPYQAKTYTYGTKVEFTDAPTRIGYTFSGWDTELGFNMPAYDMVITALWTPITYEVIFDANGGVGAMSNQTMTYDIKETLYKNVYTREGYRFMGWAIGSNSNVSYVDQEEVINLCSYQDQDITLYAVWSDTMTVSFVENGGTEVEDQYVKVNDKVIKPTNPTKAHYTFVGWYTDEGCTNEYDFDSAVARSFTLYAKWTPVNYTLTIVYDNGTENTVLTKAYGSSIDPISDPTRTGYRFDGWDKPIPSVMPGENVIITAKWVKQYTITFISQNVKVQEQTLDVGSTITAPILPDRTGFTFAGWDLDGDYSDDAVATTVSDSDLTYTALWTFTISFQSGGRRNNWGGYTNDWNDSLTINTTVKNYTLDGTNNGTNAAVTVYEGTILSVIYNAGNNGWYTDYSYVLRVNSSNVLTIDAEQSTSLSNMSLFDNGNISFTSTRN